MIDSRLNRTLVAAAVAASVALAGCATPPGLAELQGQLTGVVVATVPAQVREYETWATSETSELDGLTRNVLQPAGRSWDYQPAAVTWSYRARVLDRAPKSATYRPAARFLLELPGDAVAARHAAAGVLVQELAALTARRVAYEASGLVVVGRNEAEREWLRGQAFAGIARVPGAAGHVAVRELDGLPRAGFVANEAAAQRIAN